MIPIEEVKESLCFNDIRNPYSAIDEETAKEIAERGDDCYCDNCFSGKTALAEEVLRYYYILKRQHNF